MFTNRISSYFSSGEPTQPNAGNPRRKAKPQSIPPGFIALPQQFQGQPATLYQMAYQAAQSAANERVLQLLRSRAGLN